MVGSENENKIYKEIIRIFLKNTKTFGTKAHLSILFVIYSSSNLLMRIALLTG